MSATPVDHAPFEFPIRLLTAWSNALQEFAAAAQVARSHGVQAGLSSSPRSRQALDLIIQSRDDVAELLRALGVNPAPLLTLLEFPPTAETLGDALHAVEAARAKACEMATPGKLEPDSGAAPKIDIPPAAVLSAIDLAKLWNIPHDALRKRLERWRTGKGKAENGAGWIEASDTSGREPTFLYRVAAVKHIGDKMRS